MKGQWIIKEVYFEDGFPKIIRDLKPETPDLPTWVGLTDEEIDNIYEQHHNQYGQPEFLNYERAIEAKLKEKNT
jgi:hypothetical protein